MSVSRLGPIRELDGASSGWGFYLCARKEVRTSRAGAEYLELVLQDVTGEVRAKVFQDIEVARQEFDAGEFVKAQGRGNVFNGRLELVLDKIRRVLPDRDRLDGFQEEDCIPSSPRPLDQMWLELQGRVAATTDPHIRQLLDAIVARHGEKLRVWPAAQTVHHAYRGGLLEHILQVMTVVTALAEIYDARKDLLVSGALLHDIGKLEELSYGVATEYSVEGNLVGHIAIGLGMVRDAIAGLPDFPDLLRIEIEHLILSHHGAREFGSPVEPMTVEAFLLARADDLDATINQVRRHLEQDGTDGPFTSYHRRLERVLFKR
ncbi:MAG TPA: HD domain-containing protein [Vicinamibacterales bacterium]|nr:HD domain-containing protein [Vicinamibacterales bacterium]